MRNLDGAMIGGIICALAWAVLAHYGANDNVMKICQLSHSYDVCFTTLNR